MERPRLRSFPFLVAALLVVLVQSGHGAECPAEASQATTALERGGLGAAVLWAVRAVEVDKTAESYNGLLEGCGDVNVDAAALAERIDNGLKVPSGGVPEAGNAQAWTRGRVEWKLVSSKDVFAFTVPRRGGGVRNAVWVVYRSQGIAFTSVKTMKVVVRTLAYTGKCCVFNRGARDELKLCPPDDGVTGGLWGLVSGLAQLSSRAVARRVDDAVAAARAEKKEAAARSLGWNLADLDALAARAEGYEGQVGETADKVRRLREHTKAAWTDRAGVWRVLCNHDASKNPFEAWRRAMTERRMVSGGLYSWSYIGTFIERKARSGAVTWSGSLRRADKDLHDLAKAAIVSSLGSSSGDYSQIRPVLHKLEDMFMACVAYVGPRLGLEQDGSNTDPVRLAAALAVESRGACPKFTAVEDGEGAKAAARDRLAELRGLQREVRIKSEIFSLERRGIVEGVMATMSPATGGSFTVELD